MLNYNDVYKAELDTTTGCTVITEYGNKAPLWETPANFHIFFMLNEENIMRFFEVYRKYS
jgi:hypothetical protein